MSKEFAYNAFEELKSSLNLKEISKSEELEKIINKNYILSLYTIWETYVKKKIYDTYIDYEYLLHTEEFLRNYLKKSFGKSYLSNIFLSDLKNTKVKKEILCQSNNLNWREMEDLFTTIRFEKQNLEYLINNSKDLSSIVSVLKNSGVMPIQEKVSRSILESVKGYLTLIINLRNTISHTYKMEMDEHLSNRQMIVLVDLFKCLIGIIETFIEKELNNLFIKSNYSHSSIVAQRVLKACNGSGEQYAILEIKVTDDTIDLGAKEWIIGNENNVGFCKIKEIKVGSCILKKIPLNKVCTVSIYPSIKIKNNQSYTLKSGIYKDSKGLNIILVE